MLGRRKLTKDCFTLPSSPFVIYSLLISMNLLLPSRPSLPPLTFYSPLRHSDALPPTLSLDHFPSTRLSLRLFLRKTSLSFYRMITSSDQRLGRNSADEIKAHPFFAGVDWNTIRNIESPFIPQLRFVIYLPFPLSFLPARPTD